MADRTRITADDLERAEKALSRTYQIVAGSSAANRVLYRARIEEDAANKFLGHHKSVLFQRYLADVDPRLEPPIVTMLLHMLCVGAVAQRFADGRSD